MSGIVQALYTLAIPAMGGLGILWKNMEPREFNKLWWGCALSFGAAVLVAAGFDYGVVTTADALKRLIQVDKREEFLSTFEGLFLTRDWSVRILALAVTVYLTFLKVLTNVGDPGVENGRKGSP